MGWRDRAEHDDVAELGAQIARQAASSLAGLLACRSMSRTDLAEAMGVSSGRVSQILSGDENLTVKSLAAVAHALQAQVEISFYLSPPTGQGMQNQAGHPNYDPAAPYAPSTH